MSITTAGLGYWEMMSLRTLPWCLDLINIVFADMVHWAKTSYIQLQTITVINKCSISSICYLETTLRWNTDVNSMRTKHSWTSQVCPARSIPAPPDFCQRFKLETKLEYSACCRCKGVTLDGRFPHCLAATFPLQKQFHLSSQKSLWSAALIRSHILI